MSKNRIAPTQFKYRGMKYIVSELYINAPSFMGVYMYLKGIKHCFINGNLSKNKKSLILHNLINGKHCRNI